MSRSDVDKTRVGVLVAPEHTELIEDASWRPEDAVVEVADHLEGALGRVLKRSPEVVVVAGDDAFVGRVAQTYEFDTRLKTYPLRLYPARVGSSSRLAQQLDCDDFDVRLVRRLVKAVRSGSGRRRQVETLKVVVSSEPGARLGFSFGAGLFYRLFEAYKRARVEQSTRIAGTLVGLARDTLLEGGKNLEPVSGKVAVDGEPLAERIGYLVCSSLSRTWMGLDMETREDTAAYRVGDRGRELIKKIASSRTLPSFVRSDRAVAFERMDIDWSGGFVLDGELVEPGCAHALRVQRGPSVECIYL